MVANNPFETSYSSDKDALYSIRVPLVDLRKLPAGPLRNVVFTAIPNGDRSVRSLRRTQVKVSLRAEELDAANIVYRWLSGGRLCVQELPPTMYRANRAVLDLIRGRRLSTGHVVELEAGPGNAGELGVRIRDGVGVMFRMSFDPARGRATFRCLCGGQAWERGDDEEACLSCGVPGPKFLSAPNRGNDFIREEWLSMDPLTRAIVLPEIEAYLIDCLLWEEMNDGQRDPVPVRAFLAEAPRPALAEKSRSTK